MIMRRLIGGCAALVVLCATSTGAGAAQSASAPVHWAFLDRPSPTQPQKASFTPTMNSKWYGSVPSPVFNASPGEGWSESEQGAVGCILAGSVGTAATLYIGAANILNLIAGGGAPAASPSALYAAVAGVVFATFCGVGQAVTPVVAKAYRNYYAVPYTPPAPLLPQQPPYMSQFQRKARLESQ